MALKLRSPVLAPGGWIPAKYTCDGPDVSPPLRWTVPPSNTKSFAVIVDAQEVSAGARVHWLLYGVAGSLRELPEGVPPLDIVENIGIQGTNGFGNVGYGGPCPPPGPSHYYVFRLYALRCPGGVTASDGQSGPRKIHARSCSRASPTGGTL